MNSQLAINVCGPIVLTLDEEPLRKFRSRKALALIIFLACTKSKLPREQVADLFWDASTTKQSLSNLRTVLSMLRLQIADHICFEQNLIGICPQSPTTVDYLTLRGIIDQMPSSLDSYSAKQLSRSLELYRGEFLQDFSLNDAPRFTRWVHGQRHSLRAMVLNAYQKLTNFHLESGELTEGILITHRWLQCDPVDEAAHAILIEMLARSGRRKAAIEQYSVCRELLRKELDVEPAPEIQRLVLGLR